MIDVSEGTEYINQIQSCNTGGGCMVDYIEMTNGMIVGINDESIVLYKDWEDLNTGFERPVINILDAHFKVENTYNI